MSNGEDQLEGGKGNAPPELALDNKETSGFIAWFRKLPQARRILIWLLISNLQQFIHHPYVLSINRCHSSFVSSTARCIPIILLAARSAGAPNQ
jgi:hypothetical protein